MRLINSPSTQEPSHCVHLNEALNVVSVPYLGSVVSRQLSECSSSSCYATLHLLQGNEEHRASHSLFWRIFRVELSTQVVISKDLLILPEGCIVLDAGSLHTTLKMPGQSCQSCTAQLSPVEGSSSWDRTLCPTPPRLMMSEKHQGSPSSPSQHHQPRLHLP